MKLSKNKKIILLISGLLILTTLTTPIGVFISKSNNKNQEMKDNNQDNNQEEENKEDVEKVIKILEEKTDQQKIIILSSDSIGNIVASNKEKIIAKLKQLIGISNLKNVSIEVSMNQDQKISTSEQEIIVKVSKGKHSKIVSSLKAYFVKRNQNAQEINSDLNFVKTSLESLTTKNLEINIDEERDKTINFNKEFILSTLKGVKGYSKIDFKDSTINIKNSLALIPSSDDEPIEFTIILSKGQISIEVNGFKVKQLDNVKIQNIKRELREIKIALENLNQKIVKVHVPNVDFTINHNKINIKSAIESLRGYSNIDFKEGVKLEIKNSNQNLPLNTQEPISIILVILKNNISLEVEGFSVKQNSEDLDKVNEIIAKIKDKDILIPANVSTQNQSEIQNAIKNQLRKENQTLNIDVLSKITINNIESLILGKKVEINLIIKVRNTAKELTINLEKINLLKNSNIDKGNFGTIFQDSFGNLWAAGYKTPLQVLKVNSGGNGYVTTGWTSVNAKGILKNLNIINGFGGTIFQDSFKNLWAMGTDEKLQVLKINSDGNGYVNDGWTDVTTKGLLKNSNIKDGGYGKIFQDSFGNLWAAGYKTPLQVLKVNSDGNGYVSSWVDDKDAEGLLNDSNIVDGGNGKIFQDSFKNLWATGYKTPLQVLKVNSNGNGYVSSWVNDKDGEGLLNGSNITNGNFGTIFQDSFGNLWAAGYKTPLQVLKVNSNGNGYVSSWSDDITKGLLNGSNIIEGSGGQIFQDSFKNLWAMGKETPLQVLKVNSNGNGYVSSWSDDITKGLLNGSNIIEGSGGQIFQDSFKNLWAMGNDKKLQVLKVNSNGNGYVSSWVNDKDAKGLLNGSNITDGERGIIFQDKFKNLWAMGNDKKLQVLIANLDNTGYINSWL